MAKAVRILEDGKTDITRQLNNEKARYRELVCVTNESEKRILELNEELYDINFSISKLNGELGKIEG